MAPPPVPRLRRRSLPILGLVALLSGPAPGGEEPPIFEDVSEAVGLSFRHVNGMTGKRHLLEVMGSGCALLDYDGDGDLDIYLVQGGLLEPGSTAADLVLPPPADTPLTDRLYRNDLGPAGPALRDVTEGAGLVAGEYGMGVAVGDVDGDGAADLYVTNFGPNRLFRNRGDGTFDDRTAAAGVGVAAWSVPATFFDADGDGHLDLFVGNYLEFSPATVQRCTSPSGAPDYCGPLSFAPVADRLFHNRGDGTFEDWSDRAGFAAASRAALGAVAADLDGNGTIDLYVGNDMTPNHLWLGDGRGGFSDEALLAGAAVNWQGQPEASMGIDLADFDDDGDEDLFLAHLTGETNTLYLNDGHGSFVDATIVSGLAAASLPSTGFGAVWLDLDGDASLDLLVANGAVKAIEELVGGGDPFPVHQPNQLFRNLGGGRFEDVSALGGSAITTSEVTRGVAVGDVDNDGDDDVLLSNNHGPARLLLNRAADGSPWIGVAPRGEARGVRIVATDGSGRLRRRRARLDGSYASSHDPRIRLHLGPGDTVDVLLIRPDGRKYRFKAPAGAYLVLPETSA